MVQVTTKAQEIEPKMNEKKQIKEAPAGGAAPKPELQTVQVELPGLQVGPGPEILVYKPNQRKSEENAQGIQPGSAIWLPPQRGASWYGGLDENTLVNGHPVASPASPVWYGSTHLIACTGLVIFLLMLLHVLDRYRLLSRFRPRRSHVRSSLKVICHMRDGQSIPKFLSKSDNASNVCDMPPSYFKCPEPAAEASSKEETTNNPTHHVTCVFASGKGKVPRLLFVDPCKDKKLLEKMGLGKENVQTQQLKFNIPATDLYDAKRENTNVMIEIMDPKTESGCLIDMNVLVDKDALIAQKQEKVPLSIIVEKLNLNDHHTEMKMYNGGVL